MALTRQALSVAWYRSQATWGRRWKEYLTLVLLVGLVGGIAMASLSAARRTQSSFSTYLASTNPSNLSVTVLGGADEGGGSVNYSRAATQRIADLPGVEHVRVAIPIEAIPLRPDGPPASAPTLSCPPSLLPASMASIGTRTVFRLSRAGWRCPTGLTRS